MRLGAEHYIAINYLSLPKRGGLTVQEIADECGVSRQSIYDWQNNPVFSAELKKRMIRNTRNKLPDMLDASMTSVIEDPNAAMLKLFLQMNDMLTDAVNVGDKLNEAGDIDAMQARIQEYKDRAAKQDE